MILLAALAGGFVLSPSVPALRGIEEVAIPDRALGQTLVAERQLGTAVSERPVVPRAIKHRTLGT